MLHMAVLSHGPDTCAAAHREYGELARSATGNMETTAKKHNVSVHGGWVDAPGHLWFFLVDAPDAHTVGNLMVELKFHHWNTLNVHAVTTVEEALAITAR